MNNKVSVIIRTGASRVGCLEHAINSVYAQRHKNVELVVVENGTRELQDWLEKSKPADRELRYCHLAEANRCAAGNLGLEEATGDFICFLDDDDIFYPNHLDLLVGALEANSKADAAYAVSHEVRSQIKSYTPFEVADQAPKIVFRRKFSKGALFVNNYFPIQSVLFRRKLFEQHGGFDSNLQRLEDWDLWVKYASRSEFVFVDVVTSMYRMPSDPKVAAVRNREHDEHYPLARAKQSQIPTIFDRRLSDEIVTEIFRRTPISRIYLRLAYGGTLSMHPMFYKICEQWKLRFDNDKCEMSVLDAIKLASEVIVQNELLWNIHRSEVFIRQRIKQLLS